MRRHSSPIFVIWLLFTAAGTALAARDVTRELNREPGLDLAPKLVRSSCPALSKSIEKLPFTDPGDTCLFLGRGSLIDAYGGRCTIQNVGYTGPEAIYEVVLHEGNRVGFELDLDGSAGDLVLALVGGEPSAGDCGEGEDCVENSIDFIGPGAGPEEILARSYPAGTYHLFIDSAADGAGCGTFRLEVTGANPLPNLELTQSASPLPAVAGGALTYTLTVRNRGTLAATGVVLTDTLAAAARFLSASPGCRYEAALRQVLCELPEIPGGDTASRDVSVRIDPAARGQTVNLASVASREADEDERDNTAGLSTEITVQVDLGLAQRSSPSPLIAGQPVVYTLGVTNAGPSDATGVTVIDRLPAEVSFIPRDSSAFCRETKSGEVVCELDRVRAGGRQDVLVAGLLETSARRQIVNAVTVDCEECDAVTSFSEATPVERQADLALSQSASPTPALAGETLTYSLRVENLGPSDATGGVTLDRLPAGTSFESGSASCRERPSGEIACTIGPLAAGRAAEREIVVRIDPAWRDLLVNEVEVLGNEEDPNAANNVELLETPLTARTELLLTLSDAPDPVTAGEDLVYELEILNQGPSEATGVRVLDRLPEGAAFAAGDSSPSCQESPTRVIECSVGRLAPGKTATRVIAASVDPRVRGELVNEADVNGAEDDPTPENRVVETTTVEAQTELSLTLSDAPDPVVAGERLVYALEILNQGPSEATGVRALTRLPTGVGFAAEGSSPSCAESSPGVIDCPVGRLPPGQTAQRRVAADVDPATRGELLNEVEVSGIEDDPTPGNLVVETTTVEARSELILTLSDAPDPVVAGERLVYTLEILNQGPSEATDVRALDRLPAGTAFAAEGSSPSCEENSSGTIECTAGRLPLDETARRRVAADVDPATRGELVNEADVSATEDDPTPDNRIEETTAVEAETELVITQSDDPDPVTAGETLEYAVEIRNLGPSTATGVEIVSELPGEARFLATAPPDVCLAPSAETLVCAVGRLVVGQAQSGTITVGVLSSAAGPLEHWLEARGAENVIGGGSVAIETTTVERAADLSIAQSDDPDPVIAGETLTYTYRVRNEGPSDAAEIVVEQDLSPRLTPIASTGCREDPAGAPVCTLETVPATEELEFRLETLVDFNVPTSRTLVSRTRVTESNAIETHPGNESSVARTRVILPGTADLVPSLSDEPDPVLAGESLVYTLEIRNNGPLDAADVTTASALPAGVALVAIPVECESEPGAEPEPDEEPEGERLACDLGTIIAGEARQLEIGAEVDAAARGLIVHRAEVASSTPLGDPGLAAVEEPTRVIVPGTADLALAVEDSPDPVAAGGKLTYQLTVVNFGPLAAEEVKVEVMLPEAVIFESTTGCAEDPVGAAFCTLGTIPAGGAREYELKVEVRSDAPETFTTRATVESQTPEGNPGDEVVEVETTVIGE